MSLYYVIRPNNYFRTGVVLKTSGMGLVRPVKRKDNGEILPEEEGIAVPLKHVRGHVVRIQEMGMDNGK